MTLNENVTLNQNVIQHAPDAPGKQHVVHVGFHPSDAHVIDFDEYHVTALMRREMAERLPLELTERFARIAPVDLPGSADLEDYDRAAGRMRQSVAELAAEFGPPAAVVGLYEHTTLPAARLREYFGVPGTHVRTATLCSDKVLAKEALHDAGLPLPRYDAEESVERAICHFDGIVRDGAIRWFSASKYLDNCAGFQHRNAPLASVTLDDSARVARALEFTAAVLRVLELSDSAFHLKVFHTPGDELVFLEIGDRFGGAGIPAQQRLVYGVDMVREAVLACMGRPSELAAPATVLDHPEVGASGWLHIPRPSEARCLVTGVTGLDELPGSVIWADTPAVGAVLNEGLDAWPAAGGFLLRGPSTASVEQDLARIASSYAITVNTGGW